MLCISRRVWIPLIAGRTLRAFWNASYAVITAGRCRSHFRQPSRVSLLGTTDSLPCLPSKFDEWLDDKYSRNQVPQGVQGSQTLPSFHTNSTWNDRQVLRFFLPANEKCNCFKGKTFSKYKIGLSATPTHYLILVNFWFKLYIFIFSF